MSLFSTISALPLLPRLLESVPEVRAMAPTPPAAAAALSTADSRVSRLVLKLGLVRPAVLAAGAAGGAGLLSQYSLSSSSSRRGLSDS